MIYVTEQQVVVTAGIVVIVAAVCFILGAWWMSWRARKMAEEETRWEREEAAAQAVLRLQDPPEVADEAWLAHEDQALTLANQPCHPECFGPRCRCHRKTDDYLAYHRGEWPPPVLEPTAVLTPEEMSWTGEIQRMTAAFEEDMARIMGRTDEQRQEITR